MTTALATKPKMILRRDDDGYTYSIPEQEVQAFTYAVEAVTNAEYDSSEKSDAYDALIAEFGKYKKE